MLSIGANHIAMTVAAFARLTRNSFERLFDALVDPSRGESTLTALLVAYAATWSVYGAISHSSYDIHFDMGEMFAWSHEAGLGTPKHPPLGAWLVRAWFAVMPVAPWSYYTFAIILATVALWIVWRVSGGYLAAEKRVVGILLLTFVPFYNFHAFKFNANTVQTPFWAATTWFFIRSFETRRPGWAVLAGLAAAACMLGKYWSIFLLAGLAFAAITDRRRGAYFRSSAPWLTVASGAAALAPHLAWVMAHDYSTFDYAFTSHARAFSTVALSTVRFIVGTLAFMTLPIVLWLLVTHPRAAAIRDTLWPADPERRFLVVAFAAPMLIAVLAALLAREQIVSLWSMPAMTLLPAILLGSPLVTVIRGGAIRLLALAIVFPLLMVAVSPVVALVIHRKGMTHYRTHYRLIADAVERAWRDHTDAPLRIVGSYTNIVNGIDFYLPEAPATLDIMKPAMTPWVDDARIRRQGLAIVCPEPVTFCLQKMDDYVARYGAKVEDVTLARRFFGMSDTPVRYRIAIIQPVD